MKINIRIILILTSILSFSCEREKQADTSCLIINSEFTDKDCINLSDIVKSIEVIPLETNQECLVGTVGKILKYKDSFYIGSASILIDKILVFDKNGKFIYKLDKRGNTFNHFST